MPRKRELPPQAVIDLLAAIRAGGWPTMNDAVVLIALMEAFETAGWRIKPPVKPRKPTLDPRQIDMFKEAASA